MHFVLCFSGVNRSLSGTIGSIRRQIFEPLRRAGISYETHAAFMCSAAPLHNPRSREFNCRLERGTESLLEPRALIRIDQDDFDRTFDFTRVLAAPDPWLDGYASVRNVCRALRALDAVTDSWHGRFAEHEDTVFCYLRPDLVYHDPLPLAQIRRQFDREREELFLTPAWATCGGLNDRIACLGRRAASAYGSRLHQIDAFLAAQPGGLHAERLIRFVAASFPSAPAQPPLLLRASRLRANGILRRESFVNTSGKSLPWAWAAASALEEQRTHWRGKSRQWTNAAQRRWTKLRQTPPRRLAGEVGRESLRRLLYFGGWLAPHWSGRPVQAAARPSVTYRALATDAWGGSSINVVANARQALATHGNHQFAAYYDARARLVLAKRSLPAGPWTTQRTLHRGDVDDAHNSASIAVDGAGVLHVSWDHHNSALNYAQGSAPGSLALGPRRAMTGQREKAVSYPQFYPLPGGDLLFLYRHGGSGNGGLVLNRFNATTRAWSCVQTSLIDGEGARSPYWGAAVDRQGTLHLAWIWRESPDVASNHDLAYARSADGGKTWARSDGRRYALPITAASAEYARWIGPQRNLMNSPMVTTDRAGRPYFVTYWSDPAGTPPRFRVLWHDGTDWQECIGPAQNTSFVLAGSGTKCPPLSRAILTIIEADAERYLCLVYRDNGRDGRVIGAVRAVSGGEWREVELTASEIGGWEPSVDAAAWERFATIDLLVQHVAQRDGSDRDARAHWPRAIGTLTWSPGGEL